MNDYAEYLTQLHTTIKSYHKATLTGNWEAALMLASQMQNLTHLINIATNQQYDQRRKETF